MAIERDPLRPYGVGDIGWQLIQPMQTVSRAQFHRRIRPKGVQCAPRITLLVVHYDLSSLFRGLSSSQRNKEHPPPPMPLICVIGLLNTTLSASSACPPPAGVV